MLSIHTQLSTILRLQRLSQEKLAQELGVSFVTLNNWINSKTTPRPAAQKKIEQLYLRITGQATICQKILNQRYQELANKQKIYKNPFKTLLNRPDLFNQFLLSLTYHTNSIEGSTLTENETAQILFENQSLPNKSLIEQLEARNHQAALQYLFRILGQKDFQITEDLILRIHSILMNGIRDDAGFYRNHAVRIVGSRVITANHFSVPKLTKKLVEDFPNFAVNKVDQAVIFHAQFEKIHPFSDGNGRTGRLILIAMLLHAKFPPALIKQENKQLYYTYLQKAQIEDDYSLLIEFIYQAIEEGYQLFTPPAPF